MGLPEKRAIQEAQVSWLPKRNEELCKESGAKLAYDIEWDSFADDLKAVQWLEANGPHQVGMAFRQVCADDLGKEAVQTAVSRVVLRNVGDPEARKVSFANGVLEVQGAFAQGIKGTVRDKEIKTCLEAGL